MKRSDPNRRGFDFRDSDGKEIRMEN